MKLTRALVPSLFTVLNMFSGFSSILYASQGAVAAAAWFIILASIFDGLDGFMARMTRSSSEFGVEFDSLADVISFGAAPAFLAYKVFLYQFNGLGILLSSLVMIFGGIRLARFNIQSTGLDKEYFRGLPIPASAMLISSLILTYYEELIGLPTIDGYLLAGFLLILPALMISQLRYDTIPKFTHRDLRKHPWRFVLFLAALLVTIVSGGRALFPLLLLYVLSGPFRRFILAIKHALHPEAVPANEDHELTSMDL
ncbi:MAG: CDP-diacylglycerol--serine O-phosphatidyltransferase [Bacteroidota bacterium]